MDVTQIMYSDWTIVGLTSLLAGLGILMAELHCRLSKQADNEVRRSRAASAVRGAIAQARLTQEPEGSQIPTEPAPAGELDVDWDQESCSGVLDLTLDEQESDRPQAMAVGDYPRHQHRDCIRPYAAGWHEDDEP